ncbi:MAG TPA: hypothetical protein VNG90_05525 [Candidatus Acidoferrum sp.]|nr:hypothetical protein [Candidatus Acidoferrum sp.]
MRRRLWLAYLCVTFFILSLTAACGSPSGSGTLQVTAETPIALGSADDTPVGSNPTCFEAPWNGTYQNNAHMGQVYRLDTAFGCVHATGLPVDDTRIPANSPQGTATIVVEGKQGTYSVVALPANASYPGQLVVAGIISPGRSTNVQDRYRYAGNGTVEWLFSPDLDPGSYTIAAIVAPSAFKSATH